MKIFKNNNLKTQYCHVCEETNCPNLRSAGRDSDVHADGIEPLGPEEPANVVDLGLDYVVLTSVDRDDLFDQRAGHFAESICEIQRHGDDVLIEVLIPDFQGLKSGK